MTAGSSGTAFVSAGESDCWIAGEASAGLDAAVIAVQASATNAPTTTSSATTIHVSGERRKLRMTPR